MKKNNVVKISTIIDFYQQIHSFLSHPNLLPIARMKEVDFTRKRELTLDKLLSFLIFQNGKTSNQDLVKFYNKIGIPECIVTKQALSKALRKVNPFVFDSLLHQFSYHFYQSDLVKTYHGYIVLAEDGSTIQAPLSATSLECFGYQINQHIKEKEDVKKVGTKMGGLFDITNGFFPTVTIGKCNTSEIPLSFHNLDKLSDCIGNQKAIYLADRYYGSVELFQFHQMNQIKYCVRGKSNYFKEKVAGIQDDGWIEVEIDKKWRERLKRKDVKNYTMRNSTIRIRVIKHKLNHPNKDGETEHIYFTNLSEDEFSKEEIAKLYKFRWDIETNYKYLKVDLEAERFNTTCPYVFKCKLLAKILMLNLIGILMSEVNMEVRDKRTEKHLYGFKTKFCNIKDFFYESKLVYAIVFNDKEILSTTLLIIVENAKKRIVPIRPGRHYKRYGRFLASPPSYRFTTDGRNHPKVRKSKHGLNTVRP